MCLLQDHQTLLQKILFKERSKLHYEQFREVLLLLLAGTLTETSSEDPGIDSQVEEEELIRFDNAPPSKLHKETIYRNNEENLDNQVFAQTGHRSSIMMPQSLTQRNEITPNLVHIDFENPNEKNAPKESSFSQSPESPWTPPSFSPIKKYGRRSSPDEDLFSNDKTLVNKLIYRLY